MALDIETYKTDKTDDNNYRFVSSGCAGDILIFARFTESLKNVVQLEFGIKKENEDGIDTLFVINNKDTFKIINTVFSIVCDFTDKSPAKLIRFSGSTSARTRIFRIWILNNRSLVEKYFVLYGCKSNNIWEIYKQKVQYEAVILKRKINNGK